MAADLPAEVWAQVLQYLAAKDRARLCSVNRNFLHAVLSERYQTIGIQSSKGPSAREFQCLRQVLFVLPLRFWGLTL